MPDDATPIVIIVDDDPDVREALRGLLQSVDRRCELYGSAYEYLEREELNGPACMVLDVQLPGRSGLEFQEQLVANRVHPPIIFISGHADVPMTLRAMKGGAVEFLTKPVRHQDLLDAIDRAIDQDVNRWEQQRIRTAVVKRYEGLNARERQVMGYVVEGDSNKVIALKVGLSEVAVKGHRAQVMKKMTAKTLPELIRMADRITLQNKG